MNYSDAEIASALRHETRNMRGLAVGLRCAFADAQREGWSYRWGKHAIKTSIQATHDFAAFYADQAELERRGGRDGRLHSAWNTARRSLFAAKTTPPDKLGDVWQPFSVILQETGREYAALVAGSRERSLAIKECLKPEYAYWTRQYGEQAQRLRLVNRMDKRMAALAAQVDMMGPAGRVAFLRAFTPDMRLVGMVPE